MAVTDRIQGLVHRLSEDSTALVRSEIELAKSEVRQGVMTMGRAAAFGVVAGMLGLLALFAFVQAGIYGLAHAVALWLSALIVGGAVLLLAAIVGLIAARSAKRAKPVPTQAVTEAKVTAESIREARV
jgi:threonine/homoserine/homoserine lactone efflux protein